MAASNALIITQLLIQAMEQATQFGALLRKVQSEGRDVSDAELDEAVARYDTARQQLDADIARAKAEGR